MPDGEPDVRPAEELKDPGPRGLLRLAPAFFREDSEEYSASSAYIVESDATGDQDQKETPRRDTATVRRGKQRTRRAAKTSRVCSATGASTRERATGRATARATKSDRATISSGQICLTPTDERFCAVRGGCLMWHYLPMPMLMTVDVSISRSRSIGRICVHLSRRHWLKVNCLAHV